MDTNKKSSHAIAAVPEELAPVIRWWRANGRKSLIGVLLVVAVSLAGMYAIRQRRDRTAAAAVAITHAETIMQLENLIGQYKGAPAATAARLKLAKAYYDARRYALALETYDAFLADHPEHPMADIARLGRPHTLEAMDRHAEALVEFQTFAEQYPAHYLAPQAIFGQARCLAMQDRKDAARELLESFIEDRPESLWIDQAYSELEWVERLQPGESTGRFLDTIDVQPIVPLNRPAPVPSAMEDSDPDAVRLPETDRDEPAPTMEYTPPAPPDAEAPPEAPLVEPPLEG